MDRIEPADGSRGPPDAQQQEGSELHPLRPTSYSRNRTLSSSRRPSIRIQRPPSSYFSLDPSNNTQGPEQVPRNDDRKSVAVPQALDNDEEDFQGGRRRSHSEPRPGRWSAPNPGLLSRAATRDGLSPMLTLNEESSNQSPIATTPSLRQDDQLLAPPAPAASRPDRPSRPSRPNSRNLLRRTSEAALNTFSRNRASTVSGDGPPQIDRSSEYDPRMVDVLDVIGMSHTVRLCQHISNWTSLKIPKSPPCLPLQMSRIPSSSPTWVHGSIACRLTPSRHPRRRV